MIEVLSTIEIKTVSGAGFFRKLGYEFERARRDVSDFSQHVERRIRKRGDEFFQSLRDAGDDFEDGRQEMKEKLTP